MLMNVLGWKSHEHPYVYKQFRVALDAMPFLCCKVFIKVEVKRIQDGHMYEIGGHNVEMNSNLVVPFESNIPKLDQIGMSLEDNIKDILD